MKKLTLFLAALVFTASGAAAQVNWSFDMTHTSVRFTVTHLVISEVEGQFRKVSGQVSTPKAEDFDGGQIEFALDVGSIDTQNEQRDKHLKSGDFFEAEKYPQITFKSKSFKKESGNKYKVSGDLTIKGITKTVELDVTHNGTINDPWGNTKAGFKITGAVNRLDYGLKWNTLTEAGGAVVGDKVDIVANIELAKK